MGENRVGEMIAALAILYSLSLAFTALRVYVRVYVSKNWGADDSLLLGTLGLFTVYTAVSGSGLRYGTGRHIEDINRQELPKALMFWWLGELFYTLTTITLRLSIAVFLLRICVKRSHKMLIYATMVMIMVFSVFYFFLALFQCRPITYFWGQYAGEKGTCMEKSIFPNATFAHSAVSATADFVLGILPVCIIWDLKMNLRTKISVGFVLSLGIIAGLGTLIRIPYIRVLAITDDFLYATVDVAIWSTVEPALGIIAASACVLRPLFKKFYDLSSQGTHTRPSQYTGPSSGFHNRTGGRSMARDEEGLELGKNPAGLNRAQSVVTTGGHMTSMSNHVVTTQGRDKKGVTFLSKSLSSSSNSSQEELTSGASGGGIQVHKTVEVVRTHRRGDEDNASTSSTNSGPPLPWPKP